MKSDHSPATYVAGFLLAVTVFLVTAIPLSVFFGPISGDLTRIGNWSERDFGGKRPQPVIKVHNNGAGNPNPQVLVLGDSFSDSNIWQTFLAESGNFEILSFQYKDVGCVKNWLDWVLTREYSNLKTIVIQIAERSFVPVFRHLHRCDRRDPEPINHKGGRHGPPSRSFMGVTLDVTYLLPTAMNMLRMARSDGRIISGEVVNVPLSNPALFSNRKSNRLLYYAGDDTKRSWSEKDVSAAVENLRTIQEVITGKYLHFALVVVPDKSSVYQEYLAEGTDLGAYANVFELLKSAGVNNIDLSGFLQRAALETVDLYLPNDTHLGTKGYKLMAAKISEHIN